MATTATVKRVYLLTKAGKRGLADYVRPEKKGTDDKAQTEK